eukprot:scaffold791_cov115-Cylindrotheca_fusiformis.AAC.15
MSLMQWSDHFPAPQMEQLVSTNMRETFSEKSLSNLPQLRRMIPESSSRQKNGNRQRMTDLPITNNQTTTTRKNVRFNRVVSVKPIVSRHVRKSKTIRSQLWYDRDELNRMKCEHHQGTGLLPTTPEEEEGGFFFHHLYGMGDEQNDRRTKSKRVADAVDAVLKEQSRQKRQSSSSSNSIRSKEDQSSKRDLTPMFMIALQYSWHTSKVQEIANAKALREAEELAKLEQRDESGVSRGKKGSDPHRDNSGASMGGKGSDPHGTSKNRMLNDLSNVISDEQKKDRPKQGQTAKAALADKTAVNTTTSLVSRSAANPQESEVVALPGCKNKQSPGGWKDQPVVLDEPVTGLGKASSVHRQNRRWSSSSKRIDNLDPAFLRANFKKAVNKLITLNRFFQQIYGKTSMDRLQNVDRKCFFGKQRSSLLLTSIPHDLEDAIEEENSRNKPTKRVESILLTPAMKRTRPKQNLQWMEKLHRVKFVPIFPDASQKAEFFYTAEEINKFRFEKFIDENSDAFEEVSDDGTHDDDDNDEPDFADDESDYEYVEVSYHSDSDDEYYMEEEVVPTFDFVRPLPMLRGNKRRSL